MRRAYLHIGLPKTGTTTLQEFLRGNADLLLDRGCAYLCDPARPYYLWHGHFPVAACLLEECPGFLPPEHFLPAAEVLAELRRDAEACPADVVLSCEQLSFHLREAAALQALREALPDREIRIVCYLRRQDDLSLALHSTYVFTGGRRRFDAARVRPGVWDYDFHRMIELWASVFGPASITLREYDRGRLTGGDIRQDFVGLLGVDFEGLRVGGDSNVSLDAKQLEALRAINRHLPSFEEGGWEMLARGIEARKRLLADLPSGVPLGALLGPAERAEIMRSFEPGNRRLAAAFPAAAFAAAWHERPPAPADSPPASCEPTREELAEALAKLGLRLAGS